MSMTAIMPYEQNTFQNIELETSVALYYRTDRPSTDVLIITIR